MEAFVYIWNDKLTSRMYLGSHKGMPNDGYICSSKPMLAQYNKRPNDFKRVIVAKGTWENMRAIENRMLEKINAAHNPMYYNQTNGDKKFCLIEHNSKVRQKIAQNSRTMHANRTDYSYLKGKAGHKKGIALASAHKHHISEGLKRAYQEGRR